VRRENGSAEGDEEDGVVGQASKPGVGVEYSVTTIRSLR
jgi:hypothetical protein